MTCVDDLTCVSTDFSLILLVHYLPGACNLVYYTFCSCAVDNAYMRNCLILYGVWRFTMEQEAVMVELLALYWLIPLDMPCVYLKFFSNSWLVFWCNETSLERMAIKGLLHHLTVVNQTNPSPNLLDLDFIHFPHNSLCPLSLYHTWTIKIICIIVQPINVRLFRWNLE